jgi:hypothetical protein
MARGTRPAILGRQVFVYAVFGADGPRDTSPVLLGVFGSRESAAPHAAAAPDSTGKLHGAVVPMRIGHLCGAMPLLGAIWHRGRQRGDTK